MSTSSLIQEEHFFAEYIYIYIITYKRPLKQKPCLAFISVR